MNIIGYVRVSTIEQRNNCSLKSQRDSIIDFCKSQKWTVNRIFEDTDSGSNLDRPGFQEMDECLTNNSFDGVVVWKLDRLSRSVVDGKHFFQKVEEKGKFIKSVTESFIDTSTSIGKMVLNMVLSFAEFERDLIYERMQNGKSAAFKQGKRVEGRIPYGYMTDGNGLLVPHPQKSVNVKLIFSLYCKTQSLRKTIKHLINKEVTWDDGRAFTPQHIRIIIRNSVYIGKIIYNGQTIVGLHRPIISCYMYNKANSTLSR